VSVVIVTGRKCSCCSIGEWRDEDDEEQLETASSWGAEEHWPGGTLLCFHCGLAGCRPGDQAHVDDADGCGLCSLLWGVAMQRWSEIAP
jgi:hypothetical protein